MKGKIKKGLSIVLSSCMIVTSQGISGITLKDIYAESATIELVNGELSGAQGVYEGNTLDTARLGNNSANASDDLYMDIGTKVEFDVDTNSDDYTVYLASDATGSNQLKQEFDFDGYQELDSGNLKRIAFNKGDPANVCKDGKGSSAHYGRKIKKIYNEEKEKEEEVKVVFDLFKVELNNNHISIKSSEHYREDISKKLYENYYIAFIDQNGGFAWTLKVHLMYKADSTVAELKMDGNYVRQGKNRTFNIEVNGGEKVTDGFDWNVTNGDSVQSEDLLATIAPNKYGNTRFLQESIATLHAYSDREIGKVIVTATSNSGIMMEDASEACIALGARGEVFTKSIPVVEWIPAIDIDFTNNEYNLLVGSTIELNKLILAQSGVYDSNTGKQIDPNDEYVFTVPTSQSKLATIDVNNNGSTMHLVKAGKVELTCTAENTSVTAKCIINIIQPTDNIIVSVNDEDIASYSPTFSYNAYVRSGNELIFRVEETSGSDEELVWNEESWNGLLSWELISSVDNIKMYKITAADVDEKQQVRLELSTNRTSIGGNDPGNVSVSYMLNIFPRLADETIINTAVSYDGEEPVNRDEIDLYDDESVVIYANPEGIADGEPIDQIAWEVPENAAYISKTDYKALNSNNVLNATTVNWVASGSEPAILRAISRSNENVTKEIKINTKTSISDISLSIGNVTSPTMNLGDSAEIEASVLPENANEKIMYEAEIPSKVSVDEDGVITAKEVTDSKGVKIYAYAYHERFGEIIKSQKPLATMVVKVKEIGAIEVKPDKEAKYTDSAYEVEARAVDAGTGSQNTTDTGLAKWSLSDDSVASLNANQGSKVKVKPEKVGVTEVIAKIGDDVEGKAYLTVKAPITDSNIEIIGINTNISNTPDENAYIYLPGGALHDINPVLIAHGIDSRASDYELVKDTDYVLSNTYTEGGVVGTYKFRFTGSELYTSYKDVSYRIFPKVIGDNEYPDGEIYVEQIGDVIYNGDSQLPKLKIVYKTGGKEEELVLGKDYQFASSSNKEVGSYDVDVIGKGNFTGKFVCHYEIKNYSLSDNFETYTMFKDASGNYVISDSVVNQVWNGTEVKPNSLIKVAVKLKGETSSWKQLTEGTDYSIEYINNDRVGIATAIITGRGNYEGELYCDFRIIKKDLTKDSGGKTVIASIEDQVFTGFEVKPKVTVTCNNVLLEEGIDYELTYEDNVDTKVKSKVYSHAIVTGIGNYEGSKIQNFTIVQADISDANLVMIGDIVNQYDCGTLLIPPVTVTMGDYELVEGVDYNLFYGKDGSTEYNYFQGSTGVVTITPVSNGNYKATTQTTVRKVLGQEKFFNIIKKNVQKTADNISIRQENGDELIKQAIYVNVERTGAVNSTLYFDIEAICADGSECDDVVQAYADNSTYFTYRVIPYDSTNGNKAKLVITGKSAGRSRITLMTQQGTARNVDVIVNDPATSVSLSIKDRAGNAIAESSGQFVLFENHDYFMIPKLSVGQTDSVTWSVDNENVATINEEGKLTAIKPGLVYVTVTTNPSEVSPGGVTRQAKIIVKTNNLAETVYINEKVTSEYDLKYDKTMELTGTSVSSVGNVTEELEWSSSNENAVQIVSGQGTGKIVIKAVGPGKAIITYGSKLEAGVKATCIINVYYDVNSVELSYDSQTLILNQEYEFKATFNENAEDVFVWTSSDESIVNISGTSDEKANSQTVTIKGVGVGTATITVKSLKYGSKATCKVTIIEAFAEEVFINGKSEDSVDLMMDDTMELVGSATSEYGVVTEELTWKTSNPYAVEIVEDDGAGNVVIKAVGPGYAEITYGSKRNGGASAKIIINVCYPVSSVAISAITTDVHIGSTIDVFANFNAYAKDEFVVTNSNDDVISITGFEDGVREYQDLKVTGLKPGKSTITVSAKNTDVSDSIEITVLDNVVDEVTIDGEASSEKELKYNDTIELKGNAVSNTGAVTEKLSWKSSNEDAVEIVSGDDTDTVTIKAVGPGSSVISYGSDADGGLRAECTINVYYEVTDISLSSTELKLTATIASELTATFNEYAEDEFVWTSSDESIVKIENANTDKTNTQTVTVMGLKKGEAVITVASKKYDVSVEVKVTVADNKANKVFINGQEKLEKTLKVDDTMELVGTASAAEGSVTEKLNFTTSNDKVIKITDNNGSGKIKVKAVGEGSAVVSYVSESGIKATITIKVEKKATATKPQVQKPTVKQGPKTGSIITDSNYGYKVTKAGTSNSPGEISVKTVAAKSAKTLKIADTVTINGIVYKITEIENNAFKNNKNLVKVVIGKNVKKIGKKAFFGCKKLKKVTIKSKVLKVIGKKAFYRKGGKKLTFKVPRAKKKVYKKLIKKAKTNKYKVK